ncbi:hypothetical protein JHL18_15930 [Clostridium sp. YIM B02505]|uniref:Uncharacterized protein n=1 Tax=Clostridium yunnanense TaxID=2800325 RepID=A0ABS1ERW0_9CLOT|nr:hypothetical protein [Clostridium yunnanense]MBK1812112.1 hypothetical protein [Clostridium yunnanense]
MSKYFKVIFSIIIVILIISGIFYLFYNYNSNRYIKQRKISDIHIGVVQSTQNENIGYISFYDEKLNFLDEKKLPFGDMGDQTRVPYLSNNNFYIVPLGLGNKKDLKTIVKFDLNTGKYKSFNISQPAVLMFTVNNSDVYTTNTLNFIGHITKCDTTTGKLYEWQKEGVIISSLKCYDDILYAWATISKNNLNTPYLFVFDTKELKLLKQIPLNGCGTQQLDSYKVGNDIYFTNNLDIKGNDQSKILSKFNVKTEKLENIELDEFNPNQIIEYDDKLYITHCNPYSANLNKITIFDPKTGSKKLIEMKSVMVQTIKYKDYLYSQDMQNLYVYDIKNLNLIKKVDINKDRKSYQSRFYIGGFFVN